MSGAGMPAPDHRPPPCLAGDRAMRIVVLLACLLATVDAECVARLPTSADLRPTARVVNGLQAAPTDFDNVVTIAAESDEGLDYSCVASLIAPEWVLTAAQCFVLPNVNVVLRGSTSLSNTRFEIVKRFEHPGFNQLSEVHRDDIQLIRLARPIKDAVLATPTPSPNPQQPPTSIQTPPPLPPVNPNFNFMYINRNADFAIAQPRFLRLKGFGITSQPQQATEPLRFRPRDLKFADLRTASCDDSFGNDGKRRLCTERNATCGACYGDVGAPLFEVDKSGTFSVLVGIVTFGQVAISFEEPVCTGKRPVAYTAVARYADWIAETIKKETGEERFFFYDLPPEGIQEKDLSRDSSPLAILATTSVIVVLCLALIGTIVAVIITCVVRHLRKKRKRWLEGLQAEDSFVKAGEKDAIIVDPFEGIQNDQHTRFSFTGFSRAAAKGATEFSSRSIGMLKALVAREKDEDFFEPREPMEGAPMWLPSAWDTLFMPPSKKELEKIHKIPTQRVVDDVLSGADKSVELSLEEVAYKNKREEANLEAAWAKLEIQTSLRNLSEAAAATGGHFSPSAMSPSLTPSATSPRKGSRNSSRALTPRALSPRAMSPLASGKRKPGDFAKVDTLLAAFASIDAESEQVAEETTIDSSALRALAEAKRPNVLATLRRKFSSGMTTPSMRSNDRESDGDEVRAYGSGRGDLPLILDARGTGRQGASGSHLSSGRVSRVATALSSSSGLLKKVSLDSRHSSMLMDYFSEGYSVSNSGSDEDEQVEFEDMFDTKKRRYTEDRKPQMPHESKSILSSRSIRKSQNRSFESLERNNSTDSLSNAQDSDRLAVLPVTLQELVSTEGNGQNSIPPDTGYRNLPISTSSVSSDRRSRSSVDRSGAGPSSQTLTYSEFIAREQDQVSVHMESESSLPMQRSLPDRAEEYRSSRLPVTKLSSPSRKRPAAQNERSVPTIATDNISVHMEDEASQTGRFLHHSSDQMKKLGVSRASPRKDPGQRLRQEMLEENEDVASVHMEDKTRAPIGQTGNTNPSAGGSVSGASRVTSSVAKRDPGEGDRISVHMEEVPSFDVGADARRADSPAAIGQEFKTRNPRPVSDSFISKSVLYDEDDSLSVHMEDETATRPSVRARINAFDESERRARPRSEPVSRSAGQDTNMSVAMLKTMWNEIARKSDDGKR